MNIFLLQLIIMTNREYFTKQLFFIRNSIKNNYNLIFLNSFNNFIVSKILEFPHSLTFPTSTSSNTRHTSINF
jgi:hypothetical protein